MKNLFNQSNLGQPNSIKPAGGCFGYCLLWCTGTCQGYCNGSCSTYCNGNCNTYLVG